MDFKAWCRWCGLRIAWNRRDREWLTAKGPGGGPLRRWVCPLAAQGHHDPDPERSP